MIHTTDLLFSLDGKFSIPLATYLQFIIFVWQKTNSYGEINKSVGAMAPSFDAYAAYHSYMHGHT